MPINGKKWATFFLKAIISLGFLAWVIFRVNWNEIFNNIRKISAVSVILYVAVLFLGMAISSYKWKKLSQSKGFNSSFKEFFQLYFIGTFINNFMPSFIGGDTYKAYAIGKAGREYAKAASTVVIDRLTGLFAAMILAFIFGILNWRVTSSHPVLIFLLIAIGGFFIFMFIVAKSSKFSFWEKISRRIPEKVSEFIRILHEYYLQKKLFTKAMFLAFLFCFVGLGILNYIIFMSLGIKVGVLDYLSVIFLISIVSSIPISINNIGVQEWAYVTFFGFFGVSASAVISVSIIIRILQMIVSFFALPMYLKRKG